jgi:hypothetical protein
MASKPIIERFLFVNNNDRESSSFEAHFGKSIIVLLGNPGDGKSTLFRSMAQREPNAVFVPVREFLTYEPSRWNGKVLYLDGLDEERGRTTDGRGIVASVCQRLESIGTQKFRLSCRSADWYGDFDLNLLKGIAIPESDAVTLRLKGFTDEDIRTVLKGTGIESDVFLEKAEGIGIVELLRNPLNLELVVGIVKANGSWPSTKAGLYEVAVKKLVSEMNEVHTLGGPQYSVTKLLEQAEDLSAYQLLSDASGFSLSAANKSDSYPSIIDFVEDGNLAKASLGRRVFRSDDPLKVAPYHRSIAEFLAARALARRVDNGLPVNRAMALITGTDGGVLSEFRGLCAWLATLSVRFADSLVQRDPLGVLIYGDVPSMPPGRRASLLESLGNAAESNPYFRSGHWNAEHFAPLASKQLACLLKSKLANYANATSLATCILDGLATGEPLPELRRTLRDILNDAKCVSLHPRALRALIHTGESHNDLKYLLQDIAARKIPDSKMELRGLLLLELFPKSIGEREVADYIVAPHSNYHGAYDVFLSQALLASSDRSLPTLMDGLARCFGPMQGSYSVQRFFGRVLSKTLNIHGRTVSTKRIYRWLYAAQDEYGTTHINRDEKKSIRTWFETNQDILWRVIDHWLSTYNGNNLYFGFHKLMESIGGAQPENLSANFKSRIKTTTDSAKRVSLFESLIGQTLYQQRAGALTIEELYALASGSPELESALERGASEAIPDWRKKDALRSRMAKQREDNELRKTREAIAKRLVKIESGDDVEALTFLAERYLAVYDSSVKDKTPNERIEEFCAPEDIPRVIRGLIAFAQTKGHLLHPQDCGKSACVNQFYKVEFPFLVGMDLLWEQDPSGIDSLPEKSVQAAIVCAVSRGGAKESEWVPALLEKHKLTAIAAMIEFFRPQVQQPKAISGLALIRYDERFMPISGELASQMLGEFSSAHSESVGVLMRTAVEQRLQISGHLATWRKGCGNDVTAALYIEGAAFLLGLSNFDACERLIEGKRHLASSLCTFFESVLHTRDDLKSNTEMLTTIAGSMGSIFTYGDLDIVGHSHGEGYDSAKLVYWAIETVAKQVSAVALAALRSLKENPRLSSWADYLRYASDSQARLIRDSSHVFPSLADVAKTLSNKQPSNMADFHALTFAHLLQLREEIEKGSADLKLAFWNADGHGRPTEPRHENLCRDELLAHLRKSVEPLGIAVEPEGNYADDKRADLKVIFGSKMNVPVEIKRHYHDEVWSAAVSQLVNQYVIDPGAAGFGIYLVIWFGQSAGSCPVPPPGIIRPNSAVEMEAALNELLPEEYRNRISILVVNCEHAKNAKAIASKRSGKKRATGARGNKKVNSSPPRARRVQ